MNLDLTQRIFLSLGILLFLGFLFIPNNPEFVRIGLIAFSM
jgi:hypothetical protein